MAKLTLFLMLVVGVVFIEIKAKERVSLVIPQQIGEVILNTIKKCTSKQSDLDEYMKIIQSGSYKEDDEFKEFLKCAFVETGYTNADGKLNVPLLAVLLPEEHRDEMVSMINDCIDHATGDNAVAYIFSYFKCYQDKTPYLVKFE